jgi:hypothetical protein
MVDETTLKALFIEIHKSVHRASEEALNFGSCSDWIYPPDGGLTQQEKDSLKALKLSPDAKSGLHKLIRHACVSPIFDLFCLIDGVGDPETGNFDPWLGLTLAPKPDEYEPMLHDELYESYHDYKKHVNESGNAC